jgi:DNA repair protein RecN (Recombination protein N)
MLENLSIKDFALIEQVNIDWQEGLNVLTGETGAGKSVLIDALHAVLGGKVGPASIRVGCEKAVIEAIFSASPVVIGWLKTNELLDSETSQLVISREISKSGSRVRINGILVNHRLVQEIGSMLLAIHAQHEAHTLMSSGYQLDMLDSAGDAKHKKELERTKILYAKRRDFQLQLQELIGSEEGRLRRLDFARFQLQELEEAAIENENEDQELDQQQSVLANASLLEDLVQSAYKGLGGANSEDQCAIDLVQGAMADLEKANRIDPSLEDSLGLLQDALANLEESMRNLRRYSDALDTDPETLHQVESRIAALVSVKRKYGPTLRDAVHHREHLFGEIEKLSESESKAKDLEVELLAIENELQTVCEQISTNRKKLAATLSRQIQRELADLGMQHALFEVALQTTAEIASTGKDRVDFLIAPNPGQPLMPLAKIASGGELSRVMLAIKTIFAKADKIPTVIFDEIDTGLSGKVLQSMRDKLANLAKSHQILCITHQPIIASVADNHIQVEKIQSQSKTEVTVRTLSEEERPHALASMASGQANAEEALNFARALINDANLLK